MKTGPHPANYNCLLASILACLAFALPLHAERILSKERLIELAQQPRLWPGQLTLTTPITYADSRGTKYILAAGTVVPLIKITDENVVVLAEGNPTRILALQTDLSRRLQAEPPRVKTEPAPTQAAAPVKQPPAVSKVIATPEKQPAAAKVSAAPKKEHAAPRKEPAAAKAPARANREPVKLAADTVKKKTDSGPTNFLTSANQNLVTLKGTTITSHYSRTIQKADYIAVYYSAGWCGPCKLFTPELVKFYKNARRKGYDNFEIVFVSNDKSESSMKDYLARSRMPWPSLDFDKRDRSNLNRYRGFGIPCLVLLNRDGKVIMRSDGGGKNRSPVQVMNALDQALQTKPAS